MKLSLKDLKEEGILGTGGFGRVLLVSYDAKYYALKCMSKSYVIESGLQDHVLREREIMAELDSPFIVRLSSTFKDRYNVYMLMESVMGGELFTYLQVSFSKVIKDVLIDFGRQGKNHCLKHMQDSMLQQSLLHLNICMIDKSFFEI